MNNWLGSAAAAVVPRATRGHSHAGRGPTGLQSSRKGGEEEACCALKAAKKSIRPIPRTRGLESAPPLSSRRCQGGRPEKTETEATCFLPAGHRPPPLHVYLPLHTRVVHSTAGKRVERQAGQ
jgi:hypothetical protein